MWGVSTTSSSPSERVVGRQDLAVDVVEPGAAEVASRQGVDQGVGVVERRRARC